MNFNPFVNSKNDITQKNQDYVHECADGLRDLNKTANLKIIGAVWYFSQMLYNGTILWKVSVKALFPP